MTRKIKMTTPEFIDYLSKHGFSNTHIFAGEDILMDNSGLIGAKVHYSSATVTTAIGTFAINQTLADCLIAATNQLNNLTNLDL